MPLDDATNTDAHILGVAEQPKSTSTLSTALCLLMDGRPPLLDDLEAGTGPNPIGSRFQHRERRLPIANAA